MSNDNSALSPGEGGRSHVKESIKINATPEQVWAVLTDFEKLPQWSSSFQGVSAKLELGTTSTAYYKNPMSGKNMPFEHEIVAYEEGRQFGWSGMAFLNRKDYHVFTITPTDDGKAEFTQEDGLYGKPRNVLVKMLQLTISSAYKKFNKELKSRVEALYPA